MKKVLKFTAALLSAVIMVQSFTSVALAAEVPQTQETSSTSQTVSDTANGTGVPDLSDAQATQADAQIVAEYPEMRTESTKTFLMSDGTFLKAAYNEPIHYKDSSGTWQDIDNTLSVTNTKALTGTQVLENKAGNTKFSLSKTIKPGNTISLNSGNFSISWGLDGANTATSQIIANQEVSSTESHNDQFLNLKKLHNEILYKDALPGIDVQYLISSSAVKENIILNNKDTQKQFTETYQIGDLTVKQIDDKTIELFEKSDTEQKNSVYTINAPVMTDTGGAVSDAISISVLQQNKANGTLQIALHTDETWLNDTGRVYPVTVDPGVTIKDNASAIHDTFVTSGTGYSGTNNNTMGSMYIGNETANYKTCRILVKFDLPQFNKGDMIVGAQLNLSQMSSGMNPSTATMQLNAYEMASAWSETTATWSNTLSAMNAVTNGPILDYFNATQSATTSKWDVTKAVKDWYNGGTNNGLLLKAQDETAAARDIYYSSNYPNGQTTYPTLTINFVNNAGLEDYWSYHSQSAGRAGTGSVNDYSGNLVFSTPIMNTTGERMPMSFSLTYNNYRFGTHFKDQLKGDIFGWGWQSNLSERVDSVTENSGTNAIEKAKFKLLNTQGYRFIYLDADGTEHYFITDPNNSSKIIDEDGLGLEITSGGAGNEYYTIQYSDGSKKTFTAGGYLYRIYDNENNYITLFYYGSYLNKVIDGAGRVINIERADSGAVTKITGPDGKWTEFHYIGGNLTSIIYPDNKTIQYAYDTSNQLQKATNVDGSYIQYSYCDSSDPMTKNRIKDVTEYSTSGEYGNKVDFAYNDDNTTTFTYHTTINGTATTQKETYTFDNVGRTSSVLNMDNSAATYSYTNKSLDYARSANKITSQAATSAPVNNLLLDHNAERNNGTWTGSNWGSPGGTFSVDSSTAYLGTKSLKIDQNQPTGPQRSGAIQKLTNLAPGTTYTFSGYVKTKDVKAVGENKGANLYVACFKDSVNLGIFNGNYILGTNEWQRTSLTFTVPDGTNRVELYGGLSYANGDAWFDCLQLETGSIANIYNLLENGDFRYSASNLPTNWVTTNFASGDGMDKGDLKINGNANVNKGMYQEVFINKPANSIAFVVSGKSAGSSVPTGRDGRLYAIDAELHFTDGSTPQNVIVPFNADTTGEQYTSGSIAANLANQSKTISEIVYHIVYYKNANSASFKFLQMNMDETGTTYGYEDKSTDKLTSSKQNAKNANTYTYTNAKELLTASSDYGLGDDLNPNYNYTYSSSNAHRLQTARSKKTNIGLDFGYDNFGNADLTFMGTINDDGTLSLDNPYLQSEQEYDATGNYIISSSDQRGKTTNYDIDPTTGLTNSVTDPKHYKTEYSYNTQNNLLTKVRALSSAGYVENTYGYDDAGQLNRITHNGFDYTFVRDGFGNTTDVNVGTEIPVNLIKNVFDPNNGNLKTSTYGNGFSLNYEYDPYGRLITTKKGQDVAYQYLYDARGNLAKITEDPAGTQKITNFSYDVGDRLIKQASSDGSAIQYSYDNMDRATTPTYTFAGQTKKTTFEYGADNRKAKTTLATNGTITRTYDTLNREYITDINATAGQEPTLRTQRSFISDPSSKKTTTLIDTYTNYNHNGASDIALSQYQYTYDDNGNIHTMTDIAGNVTTYTYDGLNQLIRVDDQNAGVSTTYSYDTGGNIVNTEQHDYTIDDLGIGYNANDYIYGDGNWNDLLTSYNYQDITYDAIGNPLTYREDSLGKPMNFTWEGHQLKTAVANGKNLSYTYNSDGIRTGKTVNDVTTNYFLDGSTVIAQQTGSNDAMWFLYDSDGTRVGFTYNGTAYYYTKNAQGDVTGIVDGNNTMVVEYSYDAWGKLLSTTGTMADTLGVQNPFLYRGYYYDSETELYYLNSRYYDPTTGRYINSDNQVTAGGDLTGMNLFAYCGNNPVNRVDLTGHAWWHWALAATIVVACAVAVVATAGGAAPALIAVASVANGFAAATTASTVAAGAFIGSSMVLGTAALTAAAASSSPQEFADQGNWGTVAVTAGGAALGGASGYSAAKSSNSASEYPPNNGFNSTPRNSTLQTGSKLQRSGGTQGVFVAPNGTPTSKLSLPLDKINAPMMRLEVLRPINVQAGTAMPWFGQPGGGTQFVLPDTIGNLVGSGYIRILPN